MNAIDLLKGQHREVEELFELIDRAEDDDDKLALSQELADALAAHATIEEEIFYPEIMIDDTEDQLREAVEEHLAIKRVLVDVLNTPPSDERFSAMCKVLKEQVEHHVEEEESELFPEVRKNFAKEVLDDMGARMAARFEELQAGKPSAEVPNEIDASAPLP